MCYVQDHVLYDQPIQFNMYQFDNQQSFGHSLVDSRLIFAQQSADC